MKVTNHVINEESPSGESSGKKANYWKLAALLILGVFIFTQVFDVDIRLKPVLKSSSQQAAGITQENLKQDDADLAEEVLPKEGVVLPVFWNDLGRQLVGKGVIDQAKLESLYSKRGGLSKEELSLLTGEQNRNLKIDLQNSGFILNLLWALGLANKNDILEKGPMQNPQYGGADRFASTGGWTLAVGDAMDHYSAHAFISLTPEQQSVVQRVSENIYRPCCGNSTYFPDCNHGMAMLGLLELMASQGLTEDEMYEVALQVNSYWFPDTYLMLANYFQKRGVEWEEVNPKDVLSSKYSSAAGYQQILAETEPVQSRGGSGCGI